MPTVVEDRPQLTTVGGDDWRNLVPEDGQLLTAQDHSPEPSRTGIWVGLAAITMTFAAFTSALIVSQGSAQEWKHIVLPPILYLNTVVLLISSITLEISRHRVASFARSLYSSRGVPMAWLYATLGLGLLFVGGQYIAWVQLKSGGLFLQTSLSISFFYVLTAFHAVHVLGGLTALTVVIRKFSKPVLSLRKSTMDSTSYYWHFMSALWLYLLWILWTKL